MVKHTGRTTRHAIFKRCVHDSNVFPIIVQSFQGQIINAGVSRMPLQTTDKGVHVGLTGVFTHGRNGHVNDVAARIDHGQGGTQRHPTGAVGMKMNGFVGHFTNGFDQGTGVARFQQTRHVFDGNDVGPGLVDGFGQLFVVLQRVNLFLCGV